ncbi:DUF4652 domain-containing protein [Sporosarcina beigongshangi]|uniref:DUF4652 domain-containing protein n=1 Tax=Sporosarcina beigongshangi TaxID=2782538 RepID=UPI002ACEEB23|nr:DUF4652 domain-containing protein [Sporosarcina beigongshangi]
MTNYRMKRLQNIAENKQRIISNTRQKIAEPKNKTINWLYLSTSMAVIVLCVFFARLSWDTIGNPIDISQSNMFVEQSEVELIVIDTVETGETVTIENKETIVLVADWLNEVFSKPNHNLENEQAIAYQIYIKNTGYYPAGAISITSEKLIVGENYYEISAQQYETISSLIFEVKEKEDDIIFDVNSFGTVNEKLLKELDDVISGKMKTEVFGNGIPNAIHTVRINKEGIAIVDLRLVFRTTLDNFWSSHVKGEVGRAFNSILFNEPQVSTVYYLLEGNFSEWSRWGEFVEEPYTREMWEEVSYGLQSLFEIKVETHYDIGNTDSHSGWKTSPDHLQQATIDGKGENAIEEGEALLVIENLETSEATIYKLKDNSVAQNTPKYVEWIDENRLFVIIGYAYGTVTKGGQLYEMNIKDNTIIPVFEDLTEKEEIMTIKANDNGTFTYQKHVYHDDNYSEGHIEEGILPFPSAK